MILQWRDQKIFQQRFVGWGRMVVARLSPPVPPSTFSIAPNVVLVLA